MRFIEFLAEVVSPRKQIEEKLLNKGFDAVSFKRNGSIVAKKSYFYKHGMTPEGLENVARKLFPDAVIENSGDHWHAFVGGAKSGSAQDSYMWVQFRFPAKEEKVVDKKEEV